MATFADKPTLRGERVVLRPMLATDADAMYADLDDEEGTRFTGSHDEFTRDAIERWTASRADSDDRLDLVATDPETGAWLGELVINEWDPDNRSCAFRIALSPFARNRGVGTEATRMLLDYVFDSRRRGTGRSEPRRRSADQRREPAATQAAGGPGNRRLDQWRGPPASRNHGLGCGNSAGANYPSGRRRPGRQGTDPEAGG
jgi:RimJ/RimL family protein N-acetyltransferase